MKTVVLRCHLYIHAIFLPRQARDKHREAALKKDYRFLSGAYSDRSPATLAVKRTVFLGCHFYTKTASFYQDRLGTNILGKVEKEGCVFVQGLHAWLGLTDDKMDLDLVRKNTWPFLALVSV